MPHRAKSYAAETGITYQYFFDRRRGVVRPAGLGPGSDYIFVVTADQGPPFALRIFVSQQALVAWRAAHIRELDSSEQYALAKMALFRAFDEFHNLREEALNIVVDETNVEGLLAALDLA